MTIIKKNKVESSLKKKGFIKKNRHHKFYRLFIDEKDTGIFTKVSHGGNEIKDFHIKCMSEQIGIDKNEFMGLINCPIDKSKLIDILRNKYNFNI